MLLVDYQAINGFQSYVEAMPDAAKQAARIALNDVVEGEGLAVLRRDVLKEAAFPPGYLTDSRLGVTKRARDNQLSVTVTGRFRPTSLARFARGATIATSRKFGVKVQVKPGGAVTTFKKAFLIKLRAGATNSNDNFNLGLAIRLKPGERLRNTRGAKAISIDKGLYLLYGPSVDQIFREVAPNDAPMILEKVEKEFYRQFFRLSGKRRGRS